MRSAVRYASLSSHLAAILLTGSLMIPIAIGISGHRSRTSNTSAARVRNLAYAAGITIVRGVLVANSTSGFISASSGPCSDCKLEECTNPSDRSHLIIIWNGYFMNRNPVHLSYAPASVRAAACAYASDHMYLVARTYPTPRELIRTRTTGPPMVCENTDVDRLSSQSVQLIREGPMSTGCGDPQPCSHTTLCYGRTLLEIEHPCTIPGIT